MSSGAFPSRTMSKEEENFLCMDPLRDSLMSKENSENPPYNELIKDPSVSKQEQNIDPLVSKEQQNIDSSCEETAADSLMSKGSEQEVRPQCRDPTLRDPIVCKDKLEAVDITNKDPTMRDPIEDLEIDVPNKDPAMQGPIVCEEDNLELNAKTGPSMRDRIVNEDEKFEVDPLSKDPIVRPYPLVKLEDKIVVDPYEESTAQDPNKVEDEELDVDPPCKDPMRDSLMSNSGESDFENDSEGDNDDDGTTIHGGLAENNLDLEFDMWQGQFEISKPRYMNGHAFYKDIVKTVQMLQQQVGVLADNQVNSDDRFSRVKQDNAAYQERLMMLEEQLREAELRHEERQAEEQRRNRELISRIEREKQLTVENYTIKLSSLEKEKNTVDEESRRSKTQLEKLQTEKEGLEDRVSEAEFQASALHQENNKLTEMARREKEEMKGERERSAQVIEELRCEIERLRTAEETARKRAPSVDPQTPNTSELQGAIRTLRDENKNLVEQVEDLQAQLLTTRLEEGRTLVTSTNNNSLAAEFEAMTSEEGALYGSDKVEKLKQNLKDAQEANHHLRAYIDGILLNIVENYPQLLEVKPQPK